MAAGRNVAIACFLTCFLTIVAAPAYPAEECRTAESHEAVGELEQALEKYREQLAGATAPQCALAGAARVRAAIVADSLEKSLVLARAVDLEAADEFFKNALESTDLSPQQLGSYRDALQALLLARGKALQAAGDRDAAAERFIRVIELRPDSPAAGEAAQYLHVAALAAIRKLVATGQYRQAQEQLHSQRELNATGGGMHIVAMPVPADLEFLDSEFDIAVRELKDFWIEWQPWVFFIALFAFLLTLVRLLTRGLRRPLLEIEEFDSDGLQTKVSTGFAAMVRSRLSRLGHSAQPDDRIQMITAPIEPVNIPADVQSVVPGKFAWVGVLPWAWSKLFPRKIYRLSGYLHPPGRRGPGVTLQLSRDKGVVATQTLWQRDFLGGQPVDKDEQVASYYRLADYGSVWLAFHLAGHGFAYLGTGDWYALALSRAAYHQAKIDKQPDAAKALYIEALRTDPQFQSAKLNLALLTGTRDKKFAIKMLQQINESLIDNGAPTDDPSVYAAHYARGNWLYELSVAAGKDAPADADNALEAALLGEAESEIRELRTLIGKTLEGDGNKLLSVIPSIGSGRERLHAYLIRVDQLTRLLLAGVIAAQGRADEAISLIAANAEPPDGDPDARPQPKRAAAEPPPLELEMTLVSGVQYNLACTCAVIAASLPAGAREGWLKKALTQLSRALLLGESIDAIDDDPSLDALRNDPGLITEYRKLLDSFSTFTPAPERELPLAAAIIIGDRYADALAAENIDSPGELVQRSRTAPERQALADKLQVGADVFNQWVHYADMLRLTGLTISEANLIYLAGARSVTELAGLDPARLYASAAVMAQTQGASVAAKERYVMWVQEANALPRLVI